MKQLSDILEIIVIEKILIIDIIYLEHHVRQKVDIAIAINYKKLIS
jgi:hypothetical protein